MAALPSPHVADGLVPEAAVEARPDLRYGADPSSGISANVQMEPPGRDQAPRVAVGEPAPEPGGDRHLLPAAERVGDGGSR